MSLKPVELQFALHKIDEAGLKQNQLNQKPVEDQSHLAELSMKHAEKQRQSLSGTDPSGQATIRERNKEPNAKESKRRKPPASTKNPAQSGLADRRDHPFKGKHIDLSL